MFYYAGIGSRQTPWWVGREMIQIAKRLADTGLFALRSGGAVGADSWFEEGVRVSRNPQLKEIYTTHSLQTAGPSRLSGAKRSVQVFHPAPHKLSVYAEKLMARNYFQIMGHQDRDFASSFIVCWTPGAQITGGTGQALRMAKYFHITTWNLGHVENERGMAYWWEDFSNYIAEMIGEEAASKLRGE